MHQTTFPDSGPDGPLAPVDNAIRRALTGPDVASIDIQGVESGATCRLSDWTALGFLDVRQIDDVILATLPTSTIGFRAHSPEGRSAMTDFLKELGVPPTITLRFSDGLCSLFRTDDTSTAEKLARLLPAGVTMAMPGGTIELPDRLDSANCRASHLAELSLLTTPETLPPAAASTNFLRQFSLRGKAGELEERAQQALPLLGNTCLSGQTTIWYAPPNAGKTLCALRLTHDAITEKRIAAGNVYYFNADDSSLGLAQKLRIMDDLGAHTIAPGFNGFKNSDLLAHLKETADRDEARGTLVIIDTVKKFTSLMDKRQSSEFADACRQYSMRGGTILGLAHTAKNANPDGRLRYAGTTDLLEDFDAGYLLSPIDGCGELDEKVVEFRALKRRGDNDEVAAYAYASSNGISYEERLLSVRSVDPNEADEFKRVVAEQSDTVVIKEIAALIDEGVNQKMLLAKAAARRSGVSERAAIRILEAYTGSDPQHALWQFTVKAKGAKVYEMLSLPPPPAPGQDLSFAG
jgi:hypothetical protein